MKEPCEEVKRVEQRYEKIIDDMEKHYKEVLDKIRAEIEQLKLHKAQFLTNDNKVCIDSQEVLNVIDKYQEEREE